MRGSCPEVSLRQGTASFQTYARGGKKDKDASKVVTQVSLDNTTRQCTLNGNQVTIEVAAAGRAVAGPAGGPGPVNMPIRVAVVDADGKVIYSQLTSYRTEIPSGSGTTQFLFKKDVPITPGPGRECTGLRRLRRGAGAAGKADRQTASDQLASASTICGRSRIRLMTVSAPASVSWSA